LGAGLRRDDKIPNSKGIFGMSSGIAEWVHDEWYDVDALADLARHYDPRREIIHRDAPLAGVVKGDEGRRLRDSYAGRELASRSAAGTGDLTSNKIFNGIRVVRTIRLK